MTKSEHDGNAKERFFVAVSKNCRTAVKSSKKAVRREVTEWGVTKNNVAVLECCLTGTNINKKLTHKRRFAFMPRHHRVLENACLDFLENEMRV